MSVIVLRLNVTCPQATLSSGPHYDPTAYIWSISGYGPENPVMRPTMKQSFLSSLQPLDASFEGVHEAS